GYFQSLLYCIEGLLASLNVKDLVLPAADEVESMWRNRFGFEKLDQNRFVNAYILLYVHFRGSLPQQLVFNGFH
ncbi:UNVERIFIED_CONTAM: hypothetical protein Slati_3432300, partial [Sesamum latifolium]